MATATEGAVKRLVDTYSTIRTELKQELVERGTEIDLVTACIIARTHIILLGEPGVAKSMLVDGFMRHVEGASLWKHLLTKESKALEVFGPPSMAGLEADEFRYVTTGMLPEAHLAFGDEIFKSNSIVLNGMLMILNERQFKRSSVDWMDCPLWSFVGASNELPTHDREDLTALRDRFGFTKIVNPVRSQDAVMQVLEGQLARARGDETADSFTTIAREDIETLQEASTEVIVPAKCQRALAELRSKAENQGLNLSVRRMYEGVKVCQANALLNGRREVKTEDLRIFEHVLWADPEDIPTAQELTIDFAGAVGRKAAQLRTEYEAEQQAFADCQKQMPVGDEKIPEAVLDQLTKISANMRVVDNRVEEAINEAEDNDWDSSELESVQAEVKRTRSSVRELLGMGD